MVTYIKHNVEGNYVSFPHRLSNTQYTNIGNTWQDFLNGYWVELNNRQLKFRADNPNASVKEVYDTRLNSARIEPKTITDVINDKISEIMEYDGSDNVNSCRICGMDAWYSKEDRQSLKMRFESEEAVGKTETTLWYGKNSIVLPVVKAKEFIILLENYAAECFDTTRRHILNVIDLKDEQEIKSYDNKSGYPEKIVFDV